MKDIVCILLVVLLKKGLVCNMILQRLIGSVVLLGVLIGVITPIFTGCTAASNATAENPATAVTPSAPAVDVVDSKTKTAAYPLLAGSDMMTVIAPEAVLDILPQTAKKPLILDFTSEYCSECRALAPVLAAAEKRYAAKLTFMPIDVQKMMDAKDDTLQGKRLLLAMRPLYTPTLVAIAPGGIIVGVETGFKTSTQLDALFNKVLPQGESAASDQQTIRTQKKSCDNLLSKGPVIPKYRSLLRDPDIYSGKDYLLKGKVIQVMENGVMLNTKKNEYIGYSDEPIFVETSECKNCKFVEDDIVKIAATANRTFSYETVLKAEKTVPSFQAICGEVLN